MLAEESLKVGGGIFECEAEESLRVVEEVRMNEEVRVRNL